MPSPKLDAEIRGKGVARSSAGALRLLEGIVLPPCPYPDHRGADWQAREDTPVMCGVCHPDARLLAEAWRSSARVDDRK